MRPVEPEIAISRFVADLEYADLPNADGVGHRCLRGHRRSDPCRHGRGRVPRRNRVREIDPATLLGVDASDSTVLAG